MKVKAYCPCCSEITEIVIISIVPGGTIEFTCKECDLHWTIRTEYQAIEDIEEGKKP